MRLLGRRYCGILQTQLILKDSGIVVFRPEQEEKQAPSLLAAHGTTTTHKTYFSTPQQFDKMTHTSIAIASIDTPFPRPIVLAITNNSDILPSQLILKDSGIVVFRPEKEEKQAPSLLATHGTTTTTTTTHKT
jgi:hypothetical protein